jgi:outer membrane immunogenic protein
MLKVSRAITSLLTLLLTSLTAGAADMRLKAPPAAPPPPPFSWSGFYIGGDLGGVWANGTVRPQREHQP